MPLEPGKSKSVVKRNIAEMVRAGHPVKQAVAAAYREAGIGRAGREKRTKAKGMAH